MTYSHAYERSLIIASRDAIIIHQLTIDFNKKSN